MREWEKLWPLSSARVRQASASTVRRCVGESSSVGVSGSGGHSSVARACFSLANHRQNPRGREPGFVSCRRLFVIFRFSVRERPKENGIEAVCRRVVFAVGWEWEKLWLVVFGTCASSISVHRQTMGRRVEFCWSVGQWRAFLRGQSLLFSRESSGPRAALATRGAVFYFRFRSIAHTIFLFHCLDRGFTLTGLAPMRSKRSGDLERRRIRVAVGKEHIFLRSNRFRNFRWSASCRTAMRASAGSPRRFTDWCDSWEARQSIQQTSLGRKVQKRVQSDFFFLDVGVFGTCAYKASASTVRPSAFEIKVAGVPFSLFDTVL